MTHCINGPRDGERPDVVAVRIVQALLDNGRKGRDCQQAYDSDEGHEQAGEGREFAPPRQSNDDEGRRQTESDPEAAIERIDDRDDGDGEDRESYESSGAASVPKPADHEPTQQQGQAVAPGVGESERRGGPRRLEPEHFLDLGRGRGHEAADEHVAGHVRRQEQVHDGAGLESRSDDSEHTARNDRGEEESQLPDEAALRELLLGQVSDVEQDDGYREITEQVEGNSRKPFQRRLAQGPRRRVAEQGHAEKDAPEEHEPQPESRRHPDRPPAQQVHGHGNRQYEHDQGAHAQRPPQWVEHQQRGERPAGTPTGRSSGGQRPGGQGTARRDGAERAHRDGRFDPGDPGRAPLTAGVACPSPTGSTAAGSTASEPGLPAAASGEDVAGADTFAASVRSRNDRAERRGCSGSASLPYRAMTAPSTGVLIDSNCSQASST